MKHSADASFVVRLYDPQANPAELAAMHQYLDRGQVVLHLCELCRIEVVNVLLRRPQVQAADRFVADLAQGTWLRVEPIDWALAFRQAESLARRFSSVLRPGGHDLILVAAAVASGSSWFLSFDWNSRQRPLAAASGLRVWPELDKEEKGLALHARKAGLAR